MGMLIKFEFRKILGNRAGMVACVLAFALLVLLSVMNLSTAVLRDWDTGEVARGLAAQQVAKQRALSHAGVLDKSPSVGSPLASPTVDQALAADGAEEEKVDSNDAEPEPEGDSVPPTPAVSGAALSERRNTKESPS